MTQNEKLDNFYTSVIDNATAQSIQIIDEYKAALQKIYDGNKQAAIKKANNTYRIESENIVRKKNRKLSKDSLDLKRSVLTKTAELTDKIFSEAEKKLQCFMGTPAYKEYLIEKIRKSKDFARDDEITIYLNPSDIELKALLEEETGIKLTVSDRDFLGGIRAVIPSRTILIDDSFVTKLAEAKSSFKL